jgi:hypothetical protein
MRAQVARSISVLSLWIAVALATACGRKASGGESAISIMDFDVGRSINADNTISDKTATFSPSDVIYVSVGTRGTGTGELRARWVMGENEEIASDSRAVSHGAPTHTTFQLSRPNGLRAGEYRVEITLNGVSAGHKKFTVQ